MSDHLFLNPGGYFSGHLEGHLITLLGSCVSLCAWHPEQHLLIASHIVLPVRPKDLLLKDTRYGDVVIQTMLSDMYRFHTHVSEYRLGLFGGSTTIFDEGDYKRSVGSRNVHYVHNMVKEVLQCQIHRENTGGPQHRRLEIDGHHGRFRISFLHSPEATS